MKLYSFYHIYADGKWFKPLWEHLRALKKSDLCNHLEIQIFGILGSEAHAMQVIKFLRFYSFFFPFAYEVINHHSLDGWEQPTLDEIHEFSLNNDGYVLYAHTKGAANPEEPNPSWRKSMTHFNILKWREAVEKLKDHQAVGCHWLLPKDLPFNGYFFAGNFWWAHLSLIRTLKKPSRVNRYDAESWIGSNYHLEPFPVFDLNPGFPDRSIFKGMKVREFLREIKKKLKGLKS